MPKFEWSYSRWLDRGAMIGIESWSRELNGHTLLCSRNFHADGVLNIFAWTLLVDNRTIGTLPYTNAPDKAREMLELGVSR